jgi:cold shock CspA family protein
VTGKIKFFDAEKGYGFIIPEGKSPKHGNVFFHETTLTETPLTNAEDMAGIEVEYELNPFFKDNPRTLSVRLLSKRTYAPLQPRNIVHTVLSFKQEGEEGTAR